MPFLYRGRTMPKGNYKTSTDYHHCNSKVRANTCIYLLPTYKRILSASHRTPAQQTDVAIHADRK